MIRVWDFRCNAGHVSEHFVDDDCKIVTCKTCNEYAYRQLAAPRAHLDGISGHFPGAADKWVRNRESHMKYEKKITDNHGAQPIQADKRAL